MNKSIYDNISNLTISNTSQQILPHQLATLDFLFKSCIDKKNSVLLFHKMGSGKTMISLLFALLISSTNKIDIILPNISISNLWKQQINNAMSLLPNAVYKLDNINFLTRNQFASDIGNDLGSVLVNKAHTYNNKIIILDEAHNFFGNKMGNMMIKLRRIYDVTYILLTGSPITNTVDTLKYIVEMLTNTEFDTTKYINITGTKVYQKYLNIDGIKYIKDILSDRVSFYSKEISNIPKTIFYGEDFYVYPIYKCKMSKLQADNYYKLASTAENDMFIKLLMNVSLCALGDREIYDNFVDIVENKVSRELLPNLYISNGLLHGKELIDLNISTKLKNLRDNIFKHRSMGKRFVYFANSYIGSVVIRSVMTANGISEYDREVVNNFACIECLFKRQCTTCTPMKFAIITSREVNKYSPTYVNDLINKYNEDINDKGHKLMIIFGSKIISEAYTLKEVRDIWLLTVPETKAELTQFISRAIRTFSHKDHNASVIVRICVAVVDDKDEINAFNTLKSFTQTKTLNNEIINKLEYELNTNKNLIYDVRKFIYLITKADRAHVIDATLKSINKLYTEPIHESLLYTYVIEIIRRYSYYHTNYVLNDINKRILYYNDNRSKYEDIYTNILKDNLVVNNKDIGQCVLYNNNDKIQLINITLKFNRYLLSATI